MKKALLKNQYIKNKKKKLFKILFITMIISFFLGIMYIAIISKDNKILVSKSFKNYFFNINSNNYNYTSNLINYILTNFILTVLVWILGISIIGSPISILYLIYKSFTLGFCISSIIYFYKFKGIIPSIIYNIPQIINLIVIFILTFYSIQLSKRLYLFLFKKEETNIKYMIKKYNKLFIIMIFILIITTFMSNYLVPILLKSFTKMLI